MVSISEKDYNKLMKELSELGMTDAQFKAYIRGLISRLMQAEKSKDWELIAELKRELQAALED